MIRMEAITIRKSRILLPAAWTITLLASILPDILWIELAIGDTRWLFWAKIGFLLVCAAAAAAWTEARPLRNFVLILLGIYLSEELVSQLTAAAAWQSRFAAAGLPFTTSMLGIQLGRLVVSALMIGLLLALGYRRADFFLVRGRLDAPIEPVRWLGFPKAEPWTRFGGQFAVYISLGLLVFLIVGGRSEWSSFVRAAPMLPGVLLFAALNAFNEELTYRSSIIAGLEKAIGSKHALLNAAVFFGIGHYFGVPYGIAGVLMAGFLGWFLGKAMVETRGFTWAWFIHFLLDVLIFSFMAAGSITPGG
jgi:hypothetical protein